MSYAPSPITIVDKRLTGQTAALPNIFTYTTGTADSSYLVCFNVNVTSSSSYDFTATVDYTDETNTPQTLTSMFSPSSGTPTTQIVNTDGAGPRAGLALNIRCKASTNIVLATTGVFTSVTYNVEALIMQVA
jgi:hypothetical protein